MGLDQYVFRRDENGEIEDRVFYWRKSNQIHSWFDRLCGGVENCEYNRITCEDLRKLREDCQRVLDDHSLAEEVFPVMRGFYFGSYEYDDVYFGDLMYTVEIIDKFFEDDHSGDELFYYAWW